MERIPPLDSQPALQILLELIWFVDIVFTERPVNTAVPAVCVILLANVAVCATPKVVVFEVA